MRIFCIAQGTLLHTLMTYMGIESKKEWIYVLQKVQNQATLICAIRSQESGSWGRRHVGAPGVQEMLHVLI